MSLILREAVLLNKKPKGEQCPRCGEWLVFRSRRKGMVERLKSRLTGKYPMRCRACNHRYFMWVDPRDVAPKNPTPKRRRSEQRSEAD